MNFLGEETWCDFFIDWSTMNSYFLKSVSITLEHLGNYFVPDTFGYVSYFSGLADSGELF